MAGKIIADTLEHSTAGSVTTDYVVDGSVKAWCVHTNSAGIQSDKAMNISAGTDNGTGQYTMNFTNSFDGAVFAVTATMFDAANADFVVADDATASSIKVRIFTTAGTNRDQKGGIHVLGDLA